MDITKYINLYYLQLCQFFWGIGYFGWQIASVYAIIVLYFIKPLYSILFFVVLSISGLLNKLTKYWFISPRPKNCIKFLATEICKEGANGMPSGHAQFTAFALTAAYLFTHKYLFQSIALFLVTFIQRVVYHNHTILQLLVGSMIGVVLGICFYEIVKSF
jgi:membrane-associated phospholipid phosphatase